MRRLCLLLFSIVYLTQISNAQRQLFESWGGGGEFTDHTDGEHIYIKNNTGSDIAGCLFLQKGDGTWETVFAGHYWEAGRTYDWYTNLKSPRYVVSYILGDSPSFECITIEEIIKRYAKTKPKKRYWGYLVARDVNGQRSIISKPFAFDADDAPSLGVDYNPVSGDYRNLMIAQWLRYVNNLIEDNPDLGRDYISGSAKFKKSLYANTNEYQSARYIMELHYRKERRGTDDGLPIDNETSSLVQYDYYIKAHTVQTNGSVKKDNVVIASDFVYRKD